MAFLGLVLPHSPPFWRRNVHTIMNTVGRRFSALTLVLLFLFSQTEAVGKEVFDMFLALVCPLALRTAEAAGVATHCRDSEIAERASSNCVCPPSKPLLNHANHTVLSWSVSCLIPRRRLVKQPCKNLAQGSKLFFHKDESRSFPPESAQLR